MGFLHGYWAHTSVLLEPSAAAGGEEDGTGKGAPFEPCASEKDESTATAALTKLLKAEEEDWLGASILSGAQN